MLVFGCLTTVVACRKERPETTNSHPDAAAAISPPKADPNALQVSGIRFFGAGGRRWDAMFSRGERVVVRLLVRGLKARQRRIHLKSSLVVRGPDRSIFLQRPEASAIDREVPPGKSTKLIETAVQLDLSRASPLGAYEATLRLRDVLGGKRAEVKASFQVVGTTATPVKTLTLRRFHAPPDVDLLAGLPLHASFELAGFATRKAASAKPRSPRSPLPSWAVHLTGEAVLRDGSGVVVATHKKTLLQATMPFKATSLPVGWAIPLSAKLPQGSYHLTITVKDQHGGKTAGVTHRFTLMPGGLGIYGLRAVGAGSIPREHFLRGERLTVHMHLHGWKHPTDLGIDVGLVGPDRGFYLVRKNAHRIKDTKANGAEGRALKIPLTIPEFAPNGRWTLKLRLRDFTGKGYASRVLPFVVTGKPLRQLPSLRVSQLVMRAWPSGPPVPGLFWRAGQTLYFEAVVGGMRLKKEQSYYHRTSLTCTLRLRTRAGKLVATLKKACTVDRRFSFAPLRLRLRAKWTIPLHLAGHHTFQFEVLDRLSERVSVLQRGCFILIPRAGR